MDRRTAKNAMVNHARHQRRYPVGAEVCGEGTHFRVWAPQTRRAAVQLLSPRGLPTDTVELEEEENGYFSGLLAGVEDGCLYRLQLDSGQFPDPASRFQPDGPHGPSQVVDPSRFAWSDTNWRGVQAQGQIIYEIHIGTFSSQGTWRGAMEHLHELQDLGVTVLEVMPVADFPGRFGWGYDGVNLFAPTRLYGNPENFREFVNLAHSLGLGVILDVVYNHFGPDGNYLKHFSPAYFSEHYENEWGEPLNFDGTDSGPVREFFVSNAGYWVEEFHIDGLRLDATQQIFDASEKHIFHCIKERLHESAKGRSVYVVAENEPQDPGLVRSPENCGYGFSALWNEDFHHAAIVALTGHNEAYYTDYNGTPQELISAVKYGVLFQGQWYSWQKKTRGWPGLDMQPWQLVTFLQNHDQVANSHRGLRIHQLAGPGCYRAVTAFWLLSPGTPMLFQGQEFAASAPFLYFADHTPKLARKVARGRRKFLEQFIAIASESGSCLHEPSAPATFEKCRLDHQEREEHREAYLLHRHLLKLRMEDSVFSRPRKGGVDGAVIAPKAFVLRFFGESGDDRLLLVNLGRDLVMTSQPEPLLAPPQNCCWKIMWSSEDPRYGGNGTPAMDPAAWRVPGAATVVLAPERTS